MGETKTDMSHKKCDESITNDENVTRVIDELIVKDNVTDREPAVSFCSRVRTDRRYRCRLFHTVCTTWAMVSFGIVQTLIGLAFPDLMLIVNKDLDEASWIFTAWFCGCMLGALVSGYAYDRLNKLVVLVTLSLGLSITTATTPWCKYYPAMLIVHVIGGGFAGAIPSTVTADTIFLRNKGRARFLQIAHLATTVGGILSPIFVNAFLKDHEDHLTIVQYTSNNGTSLPSNITDFTTVVYNQVNITENIANLFPKHGNYNTVNHTAVTKLVDEFDDLKSPKQDGTEIWYAYLLASGFSFITIVLYGITYVTQGNVHANVKLDKPVANGNRTARQWLTKQKNTRRVFVIIGVVQVMFYMTNQRQLYGIFTIFAINNLQWPKRDTANAIAGFWICYGLGRLTAAFALFRFKEETLFLCHLFISIGGTIAFAASCYFQLSKLIVVCLFITAFGSAPILGFMFSWISSNITLVTGRITGLVYVSIAIGCMTVPVLSGYLMKNLSYNWFLYVLLILTFLYVSVTFLLCVLYRRIKRTTDN